MPPLRDRRIPLLLWLMSLTPVLLAVAPGALAARAAPPSPGLSQPDADTDPDDQDEEDDDEEDGDDEAALLSVACNPVSRVEIAAPISTFTA